MRPKAKSTAPWRKGPGSEVISRTIGVLEERIRRLEGSNRFLEGSNKLLESRVLLLERDLAAKNGATTNISININNRAEALMDNKGGNVISGNTVRNSTLAQGAMRDISTFVRYVNSRKRLPEELKREFEEAFAELERLELPSDQKEGVASDLKSLAGEMNKPVPEPGRAKQLLGRIGKFAPHVATMLSIAASSTNLIAGALK